MTIWFLLGRFGDGGLERVQIEIVRAMRAQGLDARLVVGHFQGNAQEQVPPDVPWMSISRAGRLWFPFALARALRRERPDIAFTSANDVACLALILRAFVSPGTRIVVAQHLSLSGPRIASTGLRRAKLEAIRWLMRRLLPNAEGIVAVTRTLAHDLGDELSIPLHRIDVIHNPAVTPDTEARIGEDPAWPWAADGVPTVVFVGRLEKVKRPDLLIEAFATLLATTEARLLIVGAGPLDGWIRQQIDARGLAPHCALVGYRANPLPYVRRSDVLVLPSDHEGFGLVLVEAMACGTQVVATDCPHGPAEILDEGTYGQLVPCGDADALAAAITRVLSGQSVVPAESLLDRSADFTLERSCQAYLRLVDRVTGQDCRR